LIWSLLQGKSRNLSRISQRSQKKEGREGSHRLRNRTLEIYERFLRDPAILQKDFIGDNNIYKDIEEKK